MCNLPVSGLLLELGTDFIKTSILPPLTGTGASWEPRLPALLKDFGIIKLICKDPMGMDDGEG